MPSDLHRPQEITISPPQIEIATSCRNLKVQGYERWRWMHEKPCIAGSQFLHHLVQFGVVVEEILSLLLMGIRIVKRHEAS
jgi:hypothetical protein